MSEKVCRMSARCEWLVWAMHLARSQERSSVKYQVRAKAQSRLLKCDNFCFMSMSENRRPMHSLSQTSSSVISEDSSYRSCKTWIYCSSDLIVMVLLLLIASCVLPKVPIFEVSHEYKNGIIFALHIFYEYYIDSKLLQEKLHVSPLCWGTHAGPGRCSLIAHKSSL